MSDYIVQLDPVEYPSGQAEVRVHVGGGKYTTFTIKNGETISAANPAAVAAVASLGPKEVKPNATPPAKATHDVDAKPKADLPPESKLAVQNGATK